MNEKLFFDALVVAWFVLALATFSALFFVTAPYGRHVRRGWGPSIKNKVGWVVMEAPAALVFAATGELCAPHPVSSPPSHERFPWGTLCLH